MSLVGCDTSGNVLFFYIMSQSMNPYLLTILNNMISPFYIKTTYQLLVLNVAICIAFLPIGRWCHMDNIIFVGFYLYINYQYGVGSLCW